MTIRPTPDMSTALCSECRLLWSDHESSSKGYVSPSECIRLLREALAAKEQPVYPIGYPIYPLNPTITNTGWTCSWCHAWVPAGTYHFCSGFYQVPGVVSNSDLTITASGVASNVVRITGAGSATTLSPKPDDEDGPPQRAGVPA